MRVICRKSFAVPSTDAISPIHPSKEFIKQIPFSFYPSEYVPHLMAYKNSMELSDNDRVPFDSSVKQDDWVSYFEWTVLLYISGKIEIRVICHANWCRLTSCRLKVNDQLMIESESIFDSNFDFTRKTIFAFRFSMKSKIDFRAFDLPCGLRYRKTTVSSFSISLVQIRLLKTPCKWCFPWSFFSNW